MRKLFTGAAVTALLVGTMAALPAEALTGSNFEIDTNANTKVDGAAPAIDWNTVAEHRKDDLASGGGDNSFGQGTKEDTAVPTVVDGSIPPNKSDLKTFGVYQEGNTTTGFLNLYWTRVQDPSGTTNMDFELNQSATLSSNGTTPVRTAGDFLLTYDLSNGGTKATISKRVWSGSAWGSATSFANDTDAIGTINTSSIPANESGGLGSLDPRTFGEAQVRLSALFGGTTQCVNFGSAYLKSRSSDAFNAALKDFIAPTAINLTNCGRVDIVKINDAGAPLAGAEFTLYQNGNATSFKCTTDQAGLCSIGAVPFGTYTVHETVVPAGHDAAPDQVVTVDINNLVVTVNLTDPRQRGAIKVTKTKKTATGTAPHQGVEFVVDGVTKATGADGTVCFDGLLFGDYVVHENVPANYQGEADKTVTVNNSATCADATYVGESVSFVNTPKSRIIVGFAPEVTGGSSATIVCKDSNGDTVPGTTPSLTDGDALGYITTKRSVALLPGTYDCRVVISAG